jgi:hypothetical protein
MATIDWNSAAGILATVFIGIVGVIFSFIFTVRPRYPGQLTYFHETPIRLLNDITGNLTDLTVSYKGKPVQKNITLLKGFLVNTGSKDITNEMVARPLRFELAEGCRWLAASAKSQQDEEEHAEITEPKSVAFRLGLFRRDEFLRFEGLTEVIGGKEPGDVVLREHRIADTGKIGWKSLPAKTSRKDFWKALAISVSVLAIGIGCLGFPRPAVGPDAAFLRMIGILLAFPGAYLFSILIFFTRRNRKIREILKLDAE